MKTFTQWLETKVQEGLSGYLPNLGQRAIPINNPQVNPQQKQVSLSSLANQVQDASWHQLYDVFSNQYKKFPNNPQVTQLGQTLYQAAQNGNMSVLQPFIQKYLYAQKV